MTIILSQRIDKESGYDDIPFVIYHYPKRYRNQIKPGDLFIYYQGDRYRRENRYYFGFGVIGKIEESGDGENYYAHIIKSQEFDSKVPIYYPKGRFYESLGYQEVRNSPNPAWQNSVRKLSKSAYEQILSAAGKSLDPDIETISSLELNSNPFEIVNELNEKYKQYTPERKDRIVSLLIDRGKGVTDALKKILGPICQICGWVSFSKRNGDSYIEAHHLTQLAYQQEKSLCSDNVILVCPNCHREIHHGKHLEIVDLGPQIKITLGEKQALIIKNTIKYLRGIKATY